MKFEEIKKQLVEKTMELERLASDMVNGDHESARKRFGETKLFVAALRAMLRPAAATEATERLNALKAEHDEAKALHAVILEERNTVYRQCCLLVEQMDKITERPRRHPIVPEDDTEETLRLLKPIKEQYEPLGLRLQSLDAELHNLSARQWRAIHDACRLFEVRLWPVNTPGIFELNGEWPAAISRYVKRELAAVGL